VKDTANEKIIFILLTLFFIFALVACDESNEHQPDLTEVSYIPELPAQTLGPFVLTISVEETTLPQGEDLWAVAELKNISEVTHEIVYNFGFMPIVPGRCYLHFGDIEIDPPMYKS
jgi:hypothetical protein